MILCLPTIVLSTLECYRQEPFTSAYLGELGPSIASQICVLGFEVNKPSKILIKTLNVEEYIELDIQNTKSLQIDDPII